MLNGPVLVSMSPVSDRVWQRHLILNVGMGLCLWQPLSSQSLLISLGEFCLYNLKKKKNHRLLQLFSLGWESLLQTKSCLGGVVCKNKSIYMPRWRISQSWILLLWPFMLHTHQFSPGLSFSKVQNKSCWWFWRLFTPVTPPMKHQSPECSQLGCLWARLPPPLFQNFLLLSKCPRGLLSTPGHRV